MNDNVFKLKTLMQKTLSEKRAMHCLNVADMCCRLADVYDENREKAYIAGILHDIRKETPKEVIKNETAISGMTDDIIELTTPALWHAVSGAYFAKNILMIKDEDIINAIRYHTVGRANMSKLEKIIYLGDLVAKGRSYPGVEKYRKYAFDNLDYAMCQAIKWSIPETINKNGKIPECTFEAYNFYIEFNK